MVRLFFQIWLAWLLLMTTNLYSQTNRALFVVIGNYSLEEYGWDKIHSVNDYELLKPLLLTHQYAEQNIRALIDREATKANIVAALNQLQQQSRAGDYIYLHFSGHGQQMADDNLDEEDGWDEAFIPYDAFYKYIPGYYEGKNHLRDDELESYLDAIRRKVGPSGNVLVVMDACHSATGTREEEDEYIRGTSYPFDEERYSAARDVNKQKTGLKNNAQMSPLTVLSACQAGESNIEYRHKNGKHYGRLSYALHLALRQNTSYTVRSLMETIRNGEAFKMPRKEMKQTPHYESVIADKTFKLNR